MLCSIVREIPHMELCAVFYLPALPVSCVQAVDGAIPLIYVQMTGGDWPCRKLFWISRRKPLNFAVIIEFFT